MKVEEAILLMQKKIELEEKKTDRKFHYVCHFMAGMNLASGNVVGWAVCAGMSGALALIRKYQNR